MSDESYDWQVDDVMQTRYENEPGQPWHNDATLTDDADDADDAADVISYVVDDRANSFRGKRIVRDDDQGIVVVFE